MRRRSIVLTGFAALLFPPAHASAQQPPAKIPRVGILSPADSDKTPIFDAGFATSAGYHLQPFGMSGSL